MISRKNIIIGIVIITVGAASFYFGSQNTASLSTQKTLELTTVKISKGDLAKKEEYNGTLSQVDKAVLNSSITGVITYLPEEGTVINYGQVLYAVDNKPVILLEGSTPFYRTLDLTSDEGPDIKQVEEALISLGYAEEGFIADEKFDETTGISSKVIIDWKSFQGKQDLKPQLVITDKDGEPVKSKGSNSHHDLSVGIILNIDKYVLY